MADKNNDQSSKAGEEHQHPGSGDDATNDHPDDTIHGDKIEQQINSDGGAVFTGPVTAGDDVIGGDQVNIYGDQVNIYQDQPQQDLTWQQLLEYSKKQHGRFWQAAQGRGNRPGIYVPGLFVSSQQSESELASFLAADTAALIVLGETGIGKTNLLCRWTSDLSQVGHAVFYYDCGGSIQDSIETDITRDLGANTPGELDDFLHQIGELAADSDRQLVLIFDAINEFRRTNQVGTATLLRQIDAMIGLLPEANVKVIFSCRTVPWRQMQHAGNTQLLWHRYYQPASTEESFLLLKPFDATTFALAYEKYRAHFNLQTAHHEIPHSLQENLMRPFLLRMLAEAYTDRGIPVTQDSLLLNIFRRFYEERVKTLEDQKFIEGLVMAMYERENSILSFDDLAGYPELYQELGNENLDSSYQRMLARGVLSETTDGVFQSKQVRFLYDLVGSYALARLLYRQKRDGSHLPNLVCEKRGFHLAWEAALILLLAQPDGENFAAVAQSPDPDLRELAVVALVEYHADQPQAALTIIDHLLQLDSPEAKSTALKAAYLIGQPAQGVFLNIASKRDRDLRRITRDALYLKWRTDSKFVNELFEALVNRVELKSILGQSRLVLEFFIDLSITIYINHCDEEGLPQEISDLYYELIKNRLHLTRIMVPAFGRLLAEILGTAMARPVMNTFQYTETSTPYLETYATAADKERLKRVLVLVEPGSDLSPELENMANMLQSPVTFVNLLAAMPLVVQATHDFATTEPLMRQLFERVNGHGRLWIILSLAVQFKKTPPQWVGMLEDFTRQIIEDNSDIYYEEESLFFKDFDIVLLPLGLAYGKQGATMPLFEDLLKEGLAADQGELLSRTLVALGPVGFYHPQAVFATLVAAIGEDELQKPEIQELLLQPLSLMRIMYLDEVDAFLQRISAGESFMRRVAAAANIRDLSQYIYRLGIYNSTVYDALYHPRMRRNFFIGAMEVLIDKQVPKAFLKYYTETAIRMSREADYHIIEWTRPDGSSVGRSGGDQG